MAFSQRATLHGRTAVILLALLTEVPAAAAAEPTETRVAPVPRVNLGAPDPRCSDLAYPLWDDGMCVRAKCADDDACVFSTMATAPQTSTATRLGEERWRTASLRSAPGPDVKAGTTLLAQANSKAKSAGVPLLAVARATTASERQTQKAIKSSPAKPAKAPPRPTFWDKLCAAFQRLWLKVKEVSRLFLRKDYAYLARGAP